MPPSRSADERTVDSIDARIEYKRSLAGWCLRTAQAASDSGNQEDALRWNSVAARMLCTGCNPIVSPALEQNLQTLAGTLPAASWKPAGRPPFRWLHVVDRALPYGGHTAMASRWIQEDASGDIHNVVILSRAGPVPAALAAVVELAQGAIFEAPETPLFMQRALWLRQLAATHADRIVLHVDGHNVVAPVAFGVPGGPPVLLVNHSAHTFWAGASIPDLVLNCRGSELEKQWTAHYRGISHQATLPIPLPGSCASDISPAERAAARESFHIPLDAIAVLSIGDGYKYAPVPGIDFADTATAILDADPRIYLLVVGPAGSRDWAPVRNRFGQRFQVFERSYQIPRFHAAADVYVEGIPFGSTTALLEAGSRGVPCVLAPLPCGPPFGTDGVAVDQLLRRPQSLADYNKSVLFLAADSDERQRLGRKLANSIRRHHTGPGWREYLESVRAQLPEAHSVQRLHIQSEPPPERTRFWAHFSITREAPDPFSYPMQEILRADLHPRPDTALFRAFRAARRAGIPLSASSCAAFLVAALPPSRGKLRRHQRLMTFFTAVRRRILPAWNSLAGPVRSALRNEPASEAQ